MSAAVTRYFIAQGRVQKVMFRQTIIRAAMKRNLEAGATNDKADKSRVAFTLKGDSSKMDEITNFMKSGKELNSWGAKVTSLTEAESGKAISDHTVTTLNVDGFNWKGGVEFYI